MISTKKYIIMRLYAKFKYYPKITIKYMEKPPKSEQFEDSLYKEILDKNLADIRETEAQNKFWQGKMIKFQERIDAILSGNVVNPEDRRAVLEDKDGQVIHLRELIAMCEKSIRDGEKFIKLLHDNGALMLKAADYIDQRKEVEEIKREDGDIHEPKKLPN